MRKAVILLMAALTLAVPARAQQEPAESGDGQPGSMGLFLRLNAKREACQDRLLGVQAECGAESVKFREVFRRYQAAREAANAFLDQSIAHFRFNAPLTQEKAKALLEEADKKCAEFEASVQTTECDGTSRKFLPIFFSVFADKAKTTVLGFFSGGERKEKADFLVQERWKSPTEFGANFPKGPAAQ